MHCKDCKFVKRSFDGLNYKCVKYLFDVEPDDVCGTWEPVTGWRNPRERRPREGATVEVALLGGGVTLALYDGSHWRAYAGRKIVEVIAWRPFTLPAKSL